MSVDPILAVADDQQINGYAYAHNNPVTFTDPTGMFATRNGVPCIDGDCSYHNSDGSLRSPQQCKAAGGCGPVQETRLRNGSTVERHRNGTVVVDGYVLPAGAPPTDPFLAAYEQAANEIGRKHEDPLVDAMVWARYACDLLSSEIWVNQCSMEFKHSLENDYDAYSFGCLMPSYVGGETGYCSEDDRDWTEDEYRLWIEMSQATGVEKQLLQQELKERGINHRPEGPGDLPWSPAGVRVQLG